MQVLKIYLENNNYFSQKMVNFPLDGRTDFTSQWLNDSTVFYLPCDFQRVHLYNFQFIADEECLESQVVEKVEELEKTDFQVSDSFIRFQEFA